jgi:hypothetical protein
MRFLLPLFLLGCGANKTRMTGVVSSSQTYFDEWVLIKVTNTPASPSMWIRLDEKQLQKIKKGSNVVFYVKLKEVNNEGR